MNIAFRVGPYSLNTTGRARPLKARSHIHVAATFEPGLGKVHRREAWITHEQFERLKKLSEQWHALPSQERAAVVLQRGYPMSAAKEMWDAL